MDVTDAVCLSWVGRICGIHSFVLFVCRLRRITNLFLLVYQLGVQQAVLLKKKRKTFVVCKKISTFASRLLSYKYKRLIHSKLTGIVQPRCLR
ncbi:hypothetical protein EVD33_07705 [Bacteroidales bacterium SW292]|nr:hypothetical protein [Bacteroidales bacterium SW292]